MLLEHETLKMEFSRANVKLHQYIQSHHPLSRPASELSSVTTPDTYLLWLMRMRAKTFPRIPSLPILLPGVWSPQPAEEQISRSDARL